MVSYFELPEGELHRADPTLTRQETELNFKLRGELPDATVNAAATTDKWPPPTSGQHTSRPLNFKFQGEAPDPNASAAPPAGRRSLGRETRSSCPPAPQAGKLGNSQAGSLQPPIAQPDVPAPPMLVGPGSSRLRAGSPAPAQAALPFPTSATPAARLYTSVTHQGGSYVAQPPTATCS